MSKHYGDIGKDSKDLLALDFPADGTVKVSVQTKTSDGTTMKATVNRYNKKEKTGLKEIISAVFEPKHELKKHNLEFTSKISTLNEFTAGLSAKDLGTQGVKVDITGTQSERDGTGAQVAASYKNELVATKVGLTYPLPSGKKDRKPLKINADLVLNVYKFLLGTNIALDLDEKTSWKGEGIISYSESSYQVTARGSHEQKTAQTLWGLSFFHKVSDRTKWALDVEADQAWLKPVASVAGEYQLDATTTVKGKWAVRLTDTSKQTELRAGVGIKQKVTPYVTATLGTDLNFRNLLGETIGDPHSFGLEVKLSD